MGLELLETGLNMYFSFLGLILMLILDEKYRYCSFHLFAAP
jgi:hypothetical protein